MPLNLAMALAERGKLRPPVLLQVLSREAGRLPKLLTVRRGLCWLLTLVWAAQIYHFSTARYSSETSWSVLEQLRQALHMTVSSSTVSALNTVVRKLAHLMEYCVLTLLLYRSLTREEPLRWRPNLAFLSIGIAGLYALGDEFHQLFVPGRGAAALDWGIDLVGATFAMLVVHRCFRFVPPKAVPT
jgi:VanZ family protein